ncbi:hypothetical protein NDU88_011899 [Pleurodeles waltl]|uniref:Uncharacterized protein n=1 Tax=Pleurodeles waltl TaxID=8319 RepID=A0AAV7QZZ7_PLEWA|nr:hypothetical protein NDU88_011899 [Pleurodeles waltl]
MRTSPCSPKLSIKLNAMMKELFHKMPVKKTDKAQECPASSPPPDDPAAEGPHSEEASITRAFLEHLFGVLCNGFATLRQDIASEVKDLQCELVDLGHSVNSLEQTHDSGRRKWTGTAANLWS